MKTVPLLGLTIFADTKPELLKTLDQRLENKRRTTIFTTYSEFLFEALGNKSFLETLNFSDINISDGISVIWACNFLQHPRKYKPNFLEFFHVLYLVVVTGASLVLTPKKVRATIPENITGVDLFWDLLELADKHGLSAFFFGGQGEVPSIVAEKAKSKLPKLHIAGFSNRLMQDPKLVTEIGEAKPDLLLVAVQPQKQELWIKNNIAKFPSLSLCIGLGGTFDYVAGKQKRAPRFISYLGLEWFFRLVTQPWRIKRIGKGFLGLIVRLVRYKLKTS